MSRKKQNIVTSPILPIQQAEYGSKEYEDIFYTKYLKYNQTTSDTECKSHVVSYLKSINNFAEHYTLLEPKKYNPSGVYIKMQKDGITLPVHAKTSISELISNLDDMYEEKKKKKEKTSKERHERDSKKINEILSFFETYLDTSVENIRNNKKPNSKFSDMIGGYKMHQSCASSLTCLLQDKIDVSLKELLLLKKDEQLTEAYSHFTTKQLSMYIHFLKELYNNISSDTLPIITTNNSKSTRKTKPKKPEQLVKKLQVQHDCVELGLSSCPLVKIIGSNLIFVYNTKTRSIIKYVSDTTFSVKGSTLINVNLSNSFKKTVRKPQKMLCSLNINNVQFMQRLWSSIKTKESFVKPRINKHCILLSCLNNNNGTR